MNRSFCKPFIKSLLLVAFGVTGSFAALIDHSQCHLNGDNLPFKTPETLNPTFDCSKITDACFRNISTLENGEQNKRFSVIRLHCDGTAAGKTFSVSDFTAANFLLFLRANGLKRGTDKNHVNFVSKFLDFQGKTGSNCVALKDLMTFVKDPAAFEVIIPECLKNIATPFLGIDETNFSRFPPSALEYIGTKSQPTSDGSLTINPINLLSFIVNLDDSMNAHIQALAKGFGSLHQDVLLSFGDTFTHKQVLRLLVPGSTFSKAIKSAQSTDESFFMIAFNEAIPYFDASHLALLDPSDIIPNALADVETLIKTAEYLGEEGIPYLESCVTAISLADVTTLASLSKESFLVLGGFPESTLAEAVEKAFHSPKKPEFLNKVIKNLLDNFSDLNDSFYSTMGYRTSSYISRERPALLDDILSKNFDNQAIIDNFAKNLGRFSIKYIETIDIKKLDLFLLHKDVNISQIIQSAFKKDEKNSTMIAYIATILDKLHNNALGTLDNDSVSILFNKNSKYLLPFLHQPYTEETRKTFYPAIAHFVSTMPISDIMKDIPLTNLIANVFPFDSFALNKVLDKCENAEGTKFVKSLVLPAFSSFHNTIYRDLSERNISLLSQHAEGMQDIDIDGVLSKGVWVNQTSFLLRILKNGVNFHPHITETGMLVLIKEVPQDLKKFLLADSKSVAHLRNVVNILWPKLLAGFTGLFDENQRLILGIGTEPKPLETSWTYDNPNSIPTDELNDMNSKKLRNGMSTKLDEIIKILKTRSDAKKLDEIMGFLDKLASNIGAINAKDLQKFPMPVLVEFAKNPEAPLTAHIKALVAEKFASCPDFELVIAKLVPEMHKKLIDSLDMEAAKLFFDYEKEFLDALGGDNVSSSSSLIKYALLKFKVLDTTALKPIVIERIFICFKESGSKETIKKLLIKDDGTCRVLGSQLTLEGLKAIQSLVTDDNLAQKCAQHVPYTSLPPGIKVSSKCLIDGGPSDDPNPPSMPLNEGNVTSSSGSVCLNKNETFAKMDGGYKSAQILLCLKQMKKTVEDAFDGVTATILSLIHESVFSEVDAKILSKFGPDLLAALTEKQLKKLPDYTGNSKEEQESHACYFLLKENTLKSVTTATPDAVVAICKDKGFPTNSSGKLEFSFLFITASVFFAALF